MTARILVIRHGALGDVVQSFGPFAAIRAHHPLARITLLTTRPFVALARLSPWFDDVVADPRPPPWNLPGLARLRRALRGFDLVYDLQTSARSSSYFRLAGRPSWSGIARGARFLHANPGRDAMHTRERQRDQLRMAGLSAFPPPDLSWLAAAPAPELPARFALLAPGAAPHRPAKRWPAERFAGLAALLRTRGLAPVVVGTAAERSLAHTVLAQTVLGDTVLADTVLGDTVLADTVLADTVLAGASGLDLTGRTDLPALAAVAARAALAVGNDTGPMHLAAAMGAPSLVLFSGDSDPALTAPRHPDGGWAAVLREPRLADLALDRVAAALPEAR